MTLQKTLASAFLSAGLILSPTQSSAVDFGNGGNSWVQMAQSGPGSNPPIEPVQVQVQEQTEFIQYHDRMRADPGVYARDLFIGHVLDSSRSINTLAERGLMSLAFQSHIRTSVEPAGIVGLDLNDPNTLENLSLIPVLYFPVTNNTERLSDDARHALQDYIRGGGFIAIDVVSGGRVNNSENLRNLLDDLQIRPPQRLEEGHSLTQSFYLLSDLRGSAGNSAIWVEGAAANLGEAGVSSVIIGDHNWAGAWSSLTVDSEESEIALRSGLNMLLYALSGHYKSDPVHDETLDQKREYLLQEDQRNAEQATPSAE